MKFLQTLCFMLSLSSFVLADDTANLKISEILKTAYEYYPSIKLSSEQIKEADTQIDLANWNFYPTPSIDVSARNGQTLTVTKIDQPLWTGGKLTSTLDIAKSKKEEVKLSSKEISYKVTESIFGVLQSYFQAKNSIEASQRGKNRLLELNAMLQRRIEAGVSSNSDNELIISRINQIDFEILGYKTKLQIAKLQLENFTGRKIDNVDFEGLNTNFLLQIDNNLEALEELLASNPTLQKMESMVKTATLEIERTKSSVYPNLSLRAEHQQGSLYDKQTNTNESLIYLTLQASSGAGLSILSNVEASKIKVLQTRLEKQTKEKEIMDQFFNDLNNYNNASMQIENRKNTITSSNNVLESYTRLFIAGRKQWLDLVNASKELTQYEVEIASLESYKNILQYKLALQLGKIDLTNGEIE